MRWTRGYRSNQVDDRRGQSSVGGGGGGFGGLPLFLMQRFGLPGLVVGVAVMYFAGSLTSEGGAPQSSASMEAEQPMVEFVSFVFDDVQGHWSKTLDSQYQASRLVLFRGGTQSACGVGRAEMGPFYCSRDARVYIDLSFYEDLKQRFGAPGDFAQAYVIAHEVGHHVQNLLGATDRVHNAPQREQVGDKGLSVRLELQADCYAGVWAHSARQRELLEVGDVEEALQAAAAIGDDRLQKQSGGSVQPESWTHGSSAERARWLRKGLESGDPKACDTFAAQAL